MKRNGIDRALVAALLLFSMAASCGRRDPGPGGAHVILALPREAVQEVSSVDVIVDQPLVEIGATSAPVPRAPFEIRPRVSGRYRWIGSRTASFVPDRPFPAATRFECVVPAGTRAVNGKSVNKDYRWWFETPRPSVARHLPDDDDIKRAGTDVRFFLEFNQPMEPAVVRRAAVLIDVASGERRGVEARRPLAGEKEVLANWPEAPVERRVVIQPEGPLRLDADWRLELAAGLKGMEGPLPTLEPWVREFRTRGPFRLIGSPAGRASTRGITLQFSNPVDADSLGAHARIDPPAPGAWSGETGRGTSSRSAASSGRGSRTGSTSPPDCVMNSDSRSSRHRPSRSRFPTRGPRCRSSRATASSSGPAGARWRFS